MHKAITRKPIYDKRHQVMAYEIIHQRSGPKDTGNALLEDAITLYGLPNLSNAKPAYVPFNTTLVMGEFVRLADPKTTVIELQSDIPVTAELIARLKTLKAHGYQIALNAFNGRASAAPLIPVLNILKVDFQKTGAQMQESFTIWSRRSRQLSLLAQNIDSRAAFEWASSLGYHLFQGSYFENPAMMGKAGNISMSGPHLEILSELNRREEADFGKISKIIHADASLTYQLMQRIQTIKYHRTNSITAIGQALVMMGIDDVRRWILLVLANENNASDSDELIRAAFLRGTFCRKLAEEGDGTYDSEECFILGMFSLLNRIMGRSLGELLQEISIAPELEAALLGTEDNYYTKLLDFVAGYEREGGEINIADIGMDIGPEGVAHLYMKSIVETDQTFTTMGAKS